MNSSAELQQIIMSRRREVEIKQMSRRREVEIKQVLNAFHREDVTEMRRLMNETCQFSLRLRNHEQAENELIGQSFDLR